MTLDGLNRRLAAILITDMVGYSRLMEEDEAGTLAQLKTHRKELIDPKIEQYDGRIVKSTGDGLMVEFSSVTNAVQCAADVQRGMADRNRQVPADRCVIFRIGINLGEVIADNDDIYGDGVNVAARLEGLAAPGSICISAKVHDEIRGKLDLQFEDLGEREIKNLKPVHVWQMSLHPERLRSFPGEGPLSSQFQAGYKPSIAVLPFDNMSADPEQEFFADGITEDIIAELSRSPNVLVIARNSTFTYKGRAVKAQTVGQDLDAQFIVEGSVRRAGNRVRITVQLIDSSTGKHIWAERYDRDLEDIFALQDEVTQAIVAILPGRVEAVALQRAKRRAPEDMAAYDYVIRGKLQHHQQTKEGNIEALRMLDKAIELDPDYAQAHAWKACALGQAWARGYRNEEDGVEDDILEELHKAYALDENDAECNRLLSAIYLFQRKFEKAEFHQEKGLRLSPSYDLLVVQNGELLTWLGKPDEGIQWIEKAMRLNPYHPERYWSHLGRALYLAHRYTEALNAFKKITSPDYPKYAFLAACCAQMGDKDESRAYAAKVVATKPDFSVERYLASLPYKNDSDREHHREGLIKAGLQK